MISLRNSMRQTKAAQFFRNLLWAAVIGFVSGLACVAVRLLFRMLQWIVTGHAGLLPDAADHLPLWRRGITPVMGAVLAMLVIAAARRAAVREKFEEYVEAVRFSGGRIPFVPTLWRTIAAAFSVATGAAIGREGSMIQFATAATSLLGRSIRIARLPLTTQVACGAAAAVATAYQAPVAGVFFATEIVLGAFSLSDAPLLLVSALTGWITGRTLLGGGPLFAVHSHLPADPEYLLFAILFAVCFGALGPGYSHLVRSMRFTARWPLPLVWSGIFVGLISLKFTEVWGNGDAALLNVMHAPQALGALLAVLILRICATTFCVGTGVVGGVFTPTLFAGSAIGLLATHFLHVSDPLLFAVVGMGCLLSAVTHAPMMATFMTVELTGQWMLLPLILVCNLIAWGVARSISSHSLYALASPEPAGDRSGQQQSRHEILPGVALPAIDSAERSA
jgi:CIC family chloride channel protein